MSAAHADLRKALEALSQGRTEEASRLCEAVLARHGGDAGALHLAAAIALTQGRPDVALARVEAAIRSNPRDARQFQTRGQARLALGQHDAAESDFLRAIELDPGFADARASLGARLVARGRFAQAREHLHRALEQRPGMAQWRFNLALCESGLGNADAAERYLAEVLRARPDWPPVLNEYGLVLHRRGDPAGAARLLESAVRADPRFAAAWNNLGAARLAQGELEAARESFLRAIEIAPDEADAWTNLGNVQRRAGDRAAAEQSFRTALARAPDSTATLRNLGNLQRERGHFEESKEILERCVASTGEPEAHFSLALTLLTMGELERGWQEYRWRERVRPDAAARDTLRRAIEANRPIELAGEQGLGDMLFFLRWVPALHADPRNLTLRCDSRLHALVASTGLVSNFEDAGAAPRAGALTIRLGDLPALVGDRAAVHPPPVPLKADPAALEAARRALREAGPPPYVAVAWRAGLAPGASEERLFKVVPVTGLGTALREVPGTIVSVQRHPLAAETASIAEIVRRPVLDASAFNDDIARITGMMAAVDSYAGVSSTNVHLRAGLGLGADILVPFPPEWRYGRGGGETPWYPGFRLHREDPAAGWGDALAALAASLAGARR